MSASKIVCLIFLSFLSTACLAQEICNNGIDDDGDNLIDLHDIDDCFCNNIGGGNEEVQSIIPNPDFEDMDCCPSNYSQLNCATTWIQASSATSDYFNTCGFSPSWLSPIPSGDGSVGAHYQQNWQENVGSCLVEPFVANEEYILQMNIISVMVDSGTLGQTGENDLGPVDVTVYGNPNCSSLPFSGTGCPTSAGWEVIGYYTYDPSSTWQEISIPLMSTVDINAISIGPPCTLPAAYTASSENPYMAYDNLILNEASLFSSSIDGEFYDEESGIWVQNGSYEDPVTGEDVFVGTTCADLVELVAHVDTNGLYQWFYEGVALTGENDTILDLTADEFEYGDYQFMININGTNECAISTFSTGLPEMPIAQFNNSLSSACYPSTVHLTDLSTSPTNIISWDWHINNTLMESGSDETFIDLEDLETHEIMLTVESQNFCSNSFSLPITLSAAPLVDFSVENACIGEQTQFTDLTQNDPNTTITSWSWEFGNLNSSLLQNPTNIFDQNVNYEVSLTVFDNNNCFASTTQTVSAYSTPQISFSNVPICIESPIASFENTSTIDDGTIDVFIWDFGNLGTSLETDPIKDFETSGTFPITLVGISNNGCQGVGIGQQYVSEVVADFSYDIEPRCTPSCGEFVALPTSSYGNITETYWNFGNEESSSTELLVERCFNNFSNEEILKHDVELIVINEFGCMDSLMREDIIEIWPYPKASFESENFTAPEDHPEFYFENTSIGADLFYWNLGDGTFTQEESVSHSYSEPQMYPVELTIYSEMGCKDVIEKEYEILPINNVFVPNSFSPQEDGINDLYRPVASGNEILDYRFEVYNRWGQKIYTTMDPSEWWNGSFMNQSSYYVPEGIYTWYIQIKFDRTTEVYHDSGALNILR